jgi:hypothetical protein
MTSTTASIIFAVFIAPCLVLVLLWLTTDDDRQEKLPS